MKRKISSLPFAFPVFLLIALVHVSYLSINAAGAVHFRIKVDASLATADRPLSGRLLIFMTKNAKPLDAIEPDFTDSEAVYICGMEVANLDSTKAIDVDADQLAFPRAFSFAPAGEYQVMALLDRDHSYTYSGAGPGDIVSTVGKVNMPAAETALTLSKTIPDPKVTVHPSMRLVEFESPMLSAFWGRPIKMEASVSLPPGYATSGKQTYPTVYKVSGYGGTHLNALYDAEQREKDMRDGKRPEMIHVFLEAQVPLGHSVFADSANNGPWGTALVNELIP